MNNLLSFSRHIRRGMPWHAPTLIILFLLLLTLPHFCFAATKKEVIEKKIEQKKQIIRQTRETIRSQKKKLRVLNARENDLADQLSNTQTKISVTSNKIGTVKVQIRENRTSLKQIKKRIEDLEQSETGQKQLLTGRLRDIYETRESDYLSVLVSSDSFTDLINRADFLRAVVNYDLYILSRIQDVHRAKTIEKVKYQNKIKEKEELRQELHGEESKLKTVEQTRKSLLWEVMQQRRSVSNYIVELEHTTEAQERELERLIIERQKSNIQNKVTSPYSASGRFRWPCDSRYITSPFGWRSHPVYGRLKFHTGLDIAARYGSSVYASYGGVIIYSGWYGGYGYAVVIDHGGGYSTLYGHCSALYARQGQRVAAGDKIAAVGSTGISTGPHLHFEVRQGGTPVNPRSKL